MFMLRRRAFFNPGPILRQPSTDQLFLLFLSARQGLLQAPIQLSQQARHVMHMILHPKRLSNEPLDPPHGPTRSRKPGSQGPLPQILQQSPLLLDRQFRGPTLRLTPAQRTHTAVRLPIRPLTVSSPADSQLASDFSLRQVSGFQQLAASPTAFLFLFQRETSWYPVHA